MAARSHRRLLLATALTAGCALAPVLPRPAHAEISVCRRDPIINLSNGATVDLTVTISDTPADVQHIAYTLHAPAGTSVVDVIYTGGMRGIESLQFQADQTTNTYKASALVSTIRNKSAAVTFTGVLIAGTGPPRSASVSGTAGRALALTLQ